MKTLTIAGENMADSTGRPMTTVREERTIRCQHAASVRCSCKNDAPKFGNVRIECETSIRSAAGPNFPRVA